MERNCTRAPSSLINAPARPCPFSSSVTIVFTLAVMPLMESVAEAMSLTILVMSSRLSVKVARSSSVVASSFLVNAEMLASALVTSGPLASISLSNFSAEPRNCAETF